MLKNGTKVTPATSIIRAYVKNLSHKRTDNYSHAIAYF